MRVRIPPVDEIQPFQRAFLDAAPGVGIPIVQDQRRVIVRADRVVVCGGAYGSPAILMRSGIGDVDALLNIGIPVALDLPRVEKNLHDHPAIDMSYAGTDRLVAEMKAFMSHHWLPEEQAIAKTRSSRCTEAFDLHLYPVGGPYSFEDGRWDLRQNVACMTPKSRGQLTLRSPDPEEAPLLDHAYLADDGGLDRAVILDGIQLARQIASQPGMPQWIGDEIEPGIALQTDREILAWINRNVAHYFHPVGTCKMGPASDPMAVVEARGKVYGADDLYVADCSISPVMPRANTNIPAAVVGERIARWLAE
jgi:choline dehydrogenase-like flavoprotein